MEMDIIDMKTRKHSLDEREKELVKLLMADCSFTEEMLEAELDEQLGYEKNSILGNNEQTKLNNLYMTKQPFTGGIIRRISFL